jgi:hypothetical protein
MKNKIIIPKIILEIDKFYVFPCLPDYKIFCVYFICDFKGNILYVGSSKQAHNRIYNHVKRKNSDIIYCIFFDTEKEISDREIAYISYLKPPKNIQLNYILNNEIEIMVKEFNKLYNSQINYE